MNETVTPTQKPARSLGEIPPVPTPGAPPRPKVEPSPQRSVGARLTIGPGVDLKGDVGSCDTMVVEGNVEATLVGEVLEISEGGRFKGTAKVSEAEIQGHFEGDLAVSGALRVRAGGHVTGTIKYGRIEVEAGGEIAGSISHDENAPNARPMSPGGLPPRS
jgi:cytoskeletal protein CcmA (bactofilin family)